MMNGKFLLVLFAFGLGGAGYLAWDIFGGGGAFPAQSQPLPAVPAQSSRERVKPTPVPDPTPPRSFRALARVWERGEEILHLFDEKGQMRKVRIGSHFQGGEVIAFGPSEMVVRLASGELSAFSFVVQTLQPEASSEAEASGLVGLLTGGGK